MEAVLETDDGNERTGFERLPPEIIHLICDYLKGNDVVRAFLSLNNRLNRIIGGLSLCTIDLSHYSRRELTDFMKTAFPFVTKFGGSLTLSNSDPTEGDCSANIEFFFSCLIDPKDLYSRWDQLQKITFVRPIIDSTICLPDIFLRSCLFYPSRDRIILRKAISANRIPAMMLCSLEVLRSSLGNHGGVHDQLLLDYENPIVNSLIPRVEHLILHVDNYEHQWNWMSPLINPALVELTVIVQDDCFEDYSGDQFRLLIDKVSDHCRLQFFLRVCPTRRILQTDLDDLVQSYNALFYTEHQCTVAIAYCRNVRQARNLPLMIYTSPLCISKLALVEHQETVGTETDPSRLTQLTLDPCLITHASMFPPIGVNGNSLPNLRSLEFVSLSGPFHTHPSILLASFFRSPGIQLRHVHFNQYRSAQTLFKGNHVSRWLSDLRFLDITDDSQQCSILHEILLGFPICPSVLHLAIHGSCRLAASDMATIREKFTCLQTLQFTLKFTASSTRQLNAICSSFIVGMRGHLRYLRIHFEQDTLLIMSLIPTEHQLGEWIGHNQHQLSHVQVIELNRKELSVWM